ncbi:ABC transporter permease [Metallococcus carri]|uniref:ABC transporter permease n=1 Tax=Metallococcus carri TaxID=1656884 RepID=UPI002E2C4262|nr:ABC transporter permease [Metallococcus carri]
MTLVQVHDLADVVVVVGFTALCAALAAVIAWRSRFGIARDQLTAAARATAQLAVVGAIITAVLHSWWFTALFCTAMIAIAGLTSARRVTGHATAWTLIPVATGSLTGGLAIAATRLVPLTPIATVPVLGILIGNAMTATSLAGRSMHAAMRDHFEVYAGALALGLPVPVSADIVARPAAPLALVPGLDQTRTVGLVTLPGAFVGALLGGASPAQAAAVQLIVLAALLLVQAVAVSLTVHLFVRGRLGQFRPAG